MVKAKTTSNGLKIVQTGSGARCERTQVLCLKALGLGRIGKTVIRKDDNCIRGLIRKVSHLVKVEDAHE